MTIKRMSAAIAAMMISATTLTGCAEEAESDSPYGISEMIQVDNYAYQVHLSLCSPSSMAVRVITREYEDQEAYDNDAPVETIYDNERGQSYSLGRAGDLTMRSREIKQTTDQPIFSMVELFPVEGNSLKCRAEVQGLNYDGYVDDVYWEGEISENARFTITLPPYEWD
ncbi:hypothetical protein ACT3SZ_14430 [Corynebacterium sp. AOP40-9SA-29]|uniref:hypothetical protein n=1 Tax=Corynebacterium sp. AOP40-9SA-29 TaxID=3457677 RepID=UPI00403397C1